MSSASLHAAACAGLVALFACGQPVAPEFAPSPERMTPRGGPAAQAATVSIAGRFYLTATERVARGGVLVDLGFRTALDGVALEGVTWISQGELRAQVPAGLAPGPHALTVTSPTGSAGTLPAAWLTSEQAPAQLLLSARLPAVVSAGQEFTAGFTASNPGGVDASEVTLQLTTAARITSLPASRTVPAGGSESLPARLVAAAPGALDWSAAVAGTDVVSGLALAGSATGTLLVESAPALAAAPGPVPAAVSVGQALELTVEVSNSGGAGVQSLSLAEPLATGAGALKLTSLPASQDLPGGATRTFRFGYLAEAAGTVTLSVAGQGQDANGAGAVALPRAQFAPVLVQAAAALAAAPLAPPARATVGQTFQLSLALTNTGGAGAAGVLPVLSLSGAGALAVAAAPAAQDLAGGVRATFTWTLQAQSPGPVALSLTAAGTDALSGAPVALSPVGGAVLVQAPAALSGVLTATPSRVSFGQAVQVQLEVTNGGEAAALAFLPQAAAPGGALPGPVAAQDLAAGATTRFAWTFTPQAPGTFTFTATGAGTDGNGAGAVAMTPATSAPVLVEAAAALSASATCPAAASVGQAFTVSLALQNLGAAAALGVAPSLSMGGAGAATVTAAPAAQDVAGGQARTFSWTVRVDAAGALAFTTAAAGADANSGAPVQAQATCSTSAQAPAALSASLAAPAAVSVGQTASVTLTVRNTGGAGAVAAAPGLLSLTPAAVAALASGPSPASATLAPGASQEFTWSFTAQAIGAAAFSVDAHALDANSGQTVTAAPATATTTVQRRAALGLAPTTSRAVVEVGQALTFSLTATNTGEAAALAAAPALSLQDTAGSGTALAASGPAPASASIPGGQSQTFTWTLQGASAGAFVASGAVAFADANDGAPSSAGPAPAAEVRVQTAPALTGSAGLSSGQLSVGQAFSVSLAVVNGGGTTATGLQATLSACPFAAALGSPASQDVPGGGDASFTWALQATGAGTCDFTASATGSDANTLAPVSVSTMTGALVIQVPGALSASLSVAPARADLGQPVTVTLDVANSGGSAVVGVAPALTFTPAGAATQSAAAPVSAAIAGHSSQTFTWTVSSGMAGILTLSGSAAGTDANSGAAVSSPPAGASLTVQRRAALSLSASVSRPVAEVGQALAFSLTATNTGEASALAVAPSLSLQDVAGSGTALAIAGPSPASAAIAGGQAQTFTWTLQGASAGAFLAKGSASGTDANDGAAVTADPAAAPQVTVQTAPALAASASLSRTQVTVGQALSVSLQVVNSGGTTAAGLLPTLSACAAASVQTAPASQDAAGGATVTFTWTLLATAASSCTFTASAAGADTNTLAPVSATASTGALLLQSPAGLGATLQAPAAANLAQPMTVSLVVVNSGDAAATGVVPQLTLSPGASAAKTAATPASATLAGHASQTFTWTVTPSATGTLSLAASAAGADTNSGAAVATPVQTASLNVQRAAALAGSLAVPAEVSLGQQFAVSYTVSNTGGAAANSVAPSALSVTGSSGGAATVLSGPAPASATVAGGGSITFSWMAQADSKGTVTLQVSAAGTDANSGGAVGSPTASQSTLVGDVSLAGGVTWSRSTVSVGQTVTVTLTVTNSGATEARDVLPGAPVLAGSATLGLTGGAPNKADIPPGNTHTYTWTYTATGPGTVTFSVGASGADKNTDLSVSMPSASSLPLTVQTAAALSAALSCSPSTDDVGDVFTVTLTVTNSGQADAAAVAPTGFGASPGSAVQQQTGPLPASAVVPGLGSKTFSWTYLAKSAAAVTFSAGASGKDSNSNGTVSAATTTTTVLLQTPASLSAAVPAPAGPVDSGDPLTVLVKVTNSGDSAASGVTPSALAVSSGSATCPGSPTPASATAPGHGSISFTWSCTAGTPGTVTFTAGASGADAVNGAAVTAPSATSPALTVQAPAALSASLALPAYVGVGSTFTAAVTVTNTGGAAANAVSPAAPLPSGANTGAASGPAGPLPAGPVSLASGASQTFTWTYTATAAGTFSLTAAASGTDANNGATRSASATGATTLNPPVVQVLSPSFPGSLSTNFSYVFSYQNQVWLGPAGDGSGAVHANPDGSSAQTATWQVEVDGVLGYSGRNLAWLLSPPAFTLGYAGCLANTTACGPDNEAGRGLFFSGTVGSTEWLAVAGARAAGGARLLYLTNPAVPQVGGRLDLLYLNLVSLVNGSTSAATAASFASSRFYLGLADHGTTTGSYTAPVLIEVRNLPSAAPGLNANASAIDAVNLQARFMPYLGVDGGAKSNPLRDNAPSTVLLDVVTSFGAAPSDALYLANNGGWLRSTKSLPGACTGPGACADWVVVTPSAAPYAAKTSLTTTATTDFSPAEKAVPAMVSFGGRLFAARNTTAGPQLWSCNPTGSTVGGAANTQCNPGDWSLAAANSSSTAPFPDGNLTQMQNPKNTAITLLAAAGGYLYVGYDNATDGVELYRTANPGASSRAEFTGSGNCNNLSLPCDGLGGKGLGAGVTRIFDSRALTFSGSTFVYLAAGTGSSTVGVYRVTP